MSLYREFRQCWFYREFYFPVYDTLKPIILKGPLQDNCFSSFLLGWAVVITSNTIAYPLDTVCRRMTMISGKAVNYKSSLDTFYQIVAKEGATSFFKKKALGLIFCMLLLLPLFLPYMTNFNKFCKS